MRELKELPFVSMAARKSKRVADLVAGTDIGARLQSAIVEEGHSLEGVESALDMSSGHLSRIIAGERWKSTIEPDLARRMAAYLHVTFEWLVIGEGARRRDGRVAPTNAEAAMRIAREYGAREDGVQAAWERNKDRENEMGVLDWLTAISAEVARLNAVGVPRPEAVKKKQREIREAGKAKRTSEGRAPALPAAAQATKVVA